MVRESESVSGQPILQISRLDPLPNPPILPLVKNIKNIWEKRLPVLQSLVLWKWHQFEGTSTWSNQIHSQTDNL